MWIVLAGIILIALVALVVTVTLRPRGDDLHSVRSYHSALGTLQHLSDRTSQTSLSSAAPADRSADSQVRARFYSRSGADGDPDANRESGEQPIAGRGPVTPGSTRSVPPVPVRGREEFPDPETPLIFDDSRPRDRYRREHSADGSPISRADRAQKHALDAMNHRPRRGASLTVVIVALVVFGVLAFVGSRRSQSPNHGHAVSATSSSVAQTSGSVPTSSTSSSTSHRGTTTKPKKKTKTTPTTAPTQIVAVSSTSSTAVYSVGSTSYRVTVTATGPCWVAATNVATGSTLWAGTLDAGVVQEIQASGTITVQLGTPAASLALNSVPVIFPTPVQSPFVATFQPAGSTSSTGGGSSTSATTTGTAAGSG